MGQKILVVEDNELNLKLFCDLLRAHGYEAEPVRDGREALERARAFAPDLVVMDIQMPHISGLELIEQMKADAALRHMPIMAVTAYAAKGDEERIRDAGAEGYVSKPISVMKFVAAVAALLEAAEERREEAAAASHASDPPAGAEIAPSHPPGEGPDDAASAPAAEPDAEAEPATEAEPDAEAEPATEAKPDAEAEPATEAKPGAEAAPDPDAGPAESPVPNVDQADAPAREPRLYDPPEEGQEPPRLI